MFPGVSDTMSEDVIAYLLHETNEEERLAFSEKWMDDPVLHEQLRMAEAELLDAYVRDDVSAERRRRIEVYLLTSPRQLEKLAFARQLHERLAVPRRAVPWFRWAAAAGILALAGAALWLARENGSLERQVMEARLHPPAPPAAGAPFAVRLAESDTRGASAEARVTIPAGAEVVRLELEMNAADRSDAGRIDISLGGRTVWSQTPVAELSRGGKLAATAWVPAAILVPGRYEIKLSSGGSALGYYQVIVTR